MAVYKGVKIHLNCKVDPGYYCFGNNKVKIDAECLSRNPFI